MNTKPYSQCVCRGARGNLGCFIRLRRFNRRAFAVNTLQKYQTELELRLLLSESEIHLHDRLALVESGDEHRFRLQAPRHSS